jgi:polyhydroxybutyrate depolymerase
MAATPGRSHLREARRSIRPDDLCCGGSVATATPRTSPSAIQQATPSSGPSETQQATLTVAGQARLYTIFRPSSLDTAKLAPLVIALHGYTQGSLELEGTTHFDDQARKSGFVVVYPQGVNDSWNAGSCCGTAQSQNLDDVEFIRELIASLVTGGHIDPKRVFATGLSNGGMMVHLLACVLSERIAAVASVSGALTVPTCRPGRPISVLEMHGTGDSLVPYAGGSTAGLGSFPPTMSFMKRWANIEHCAAKPTISQKGITTTSTWTGCRGGSVVVLQAIAGAEHGWFGGAGALPGEPDATQAVWTFFSGLPPRA